MTIIALGSLVACGAPATTPADLAEPPLPDGGDDLAPAGDLAMPAPLSIEPAQVRVPIGRGQTFVAAGATSWSVMESGGGTVSDGRYLAPTTPGTYHVIAGDGTRTGRATIEVTRDELTLLAGATGGCGYLDGSGAAARFGGNLHLVTDGLGTAWIADPSNHVIRSVVLATGAVTTLAGARDRAATVDGPFASATFDSPARLAFDGLGQRLFVADDAAHVIRVIDLAARTVTTLAGTPRMPGETDDTGAAARFSSPSGLAFDGLRTLYVADAGNHRIRAVDVMTGAVSTLAGSTYGATDVDGTGSAAKFAAPSGLALVSGTLYVGERSPGRGIRTVDVSTRAVGHITGTSFDNVRDLRADGSGNLYVATDNLSFVSRVVLSTGAVTLLAGNANREAINGTGTLAAWDNLSGIALDGNRLLTVEGFAGDCMMRALALGDLSVSDVAGSRRPFGRRSGTIGANRLYTPTGMSLDGDNLLFTDWSNFVVQQLSLTSTDVGTVSGSGASGAIDGDPNTGAYAAPNDVIPDGASAFLVADQGAPAIRRRDALGQLTTPYGAAGMSGIVDGVGTAARFVSPRRLVRDGGTIFVADDNTVRAIDVATGAVTTVAGSPTNQPGYVDGVGDAARFRIINGLASDGAGGLYISDAGCTLRHLTVATRSVRTVAGVNGECRLVDGIGTAARFLAFGPLVRDGAFLYVADERYLRRVYLPTGAVDTVLGAAGWVGVRLGTVDVATLNAATNGLTVDASGHLLLANESAILRFGAP